MHSLNCVTWTELCNILQWTQVYKLLIGANGISRWMLLQVVITSLCEAVM